MSVRVHSFSAARSYRIGQIQSEKLRWARGDLKVQVQGWFHGFFSSPHTQLPTALFSSPRGWGRGWKLGSLWGGPCGSLPRAGPSQDAQVSSQPSAISHTWRGSGGAHRDAAISSFPSEDLRKTRGEGLGDPCEMRKKKREKINSPQGTHSTQTAGLCYSAVRNHFMQRCLEIFLSGVSGGKNRK